MENQELKHLIFYGLWFFYMGCLFAGVYALIYISTR